MRFTFLGTGTSAGVPAIGCDCAVCTSSDPRDSRLRTSAMIEWTDLGGQPRTLLIDAGPDLRQQMLRHRPARLDAIVLTHHHVDHTFGLDEVRRFNLMMRQPIDIFADGHTLAQLRRVYAHIFEPERNTQPSFVASLREHELRPHQPIAVAGLRLTPLPLLHGRLPILGFRIEPEQGLTRPPWAPLAYCTDVSAIPDEARPHLTGLGTLVLDALRHRPHDTHFTLDQAVAEARAINAERTLFVHMAHDLAHASTNTALPPGMALAHDGLVLT